MLVMLDMSGKDGKCIWLGMLLDMAMGACIALGDGKGRCAIWGFEY